MLPHQPERPVPSWAHILVIHLASLALGILVIACLLMFSLGVVGLLFSRIEHHVQTGLLTILGSGVLMVIIHVGANSLRNLSRKWGVSRD